MKEKSNMQIAMIEIKENVHLLVNCVNGKSLVNLFHRCTSLLHRLEGLIVDIRRFDRVHLLLKLNDLTRR